MSTPDGRSDTMGDAAEQVLGALLDERLGGRTPPDLTARVLAAARRGGDDSHLGPVESPNDTMTDSKMPVSLDSLDLASEEFVAAGRQADRGLLAEFAGFMVDNSKWWLVPFLVVFGLLGVLLALGATGAAPFIYTLF